MPCGVTYVVGDGIKGVWFAGLMNPHPMPMKSKTMLTFRITIRPLTKADSFVPRISSAVSRRRMKTAGMFIIPYAPFGSCSKGECDHWYGMRIPNHSSTRFAYSLQAIETVDAATAYSRIKSQPMIHATNSPIVAYEYVYALPATGIIDANSA